LPASRSRNTSPRSILSLWLNRDTLPKFYAANDISSGEYEKIGKTALAQAKKKQDQLEIAEKLESLADLYCGKAKFTTAEPLYLQAITLREALGNERSNADDLRKSIQKLCTVYRIEGRQTEADQLDKKPF
jgi:hypothetical protein